MRKLLLLLAFLSPLVAAAIVVYVAAPADWKFSKQESPTATKRVVPKTLAEARKMARERFEHLQKLTQAQWDIERVTIPHKHPPARILEAVARAYQRVEDLERFTEEEWPAEREKMLARVPEN